MTRGGAALPVRMARAGFEQAERSAALLRSLGWSEEALGDLVDQLAAVADPELALDVFVVLLEHSPGLEFDLENRARLLAVAGASRALGDHLIRHPSHVEVLSTSEAIDERPSDSVVRNSLLRAVGADPAAAQPVAAAHTTDILDALRIEYRRHLVALAARDLVGGDDGPARLEDVAASLADLADAALEAALAIARSEVGPAAEETQLAIIGMGKCGARELNYISDVDVIFVAQAPEDDPGLAVATQLAAAVMRVCSSTTAEGSLWEVDAGLRPEGKAGALVRTLASHLGYYERWAKTWEFQALLKARPSAGDRELGAAYVDAVLPLVWSAADRPGFVEDVQAMRRRVESHVPQREADRELKLGPGGLRDVEFCVQLLQLVHGRTDVLLRSPTTLTALESLSLWGYVGRADAATLASAYRFLRTLEHRIQLHRMRRTHVVPEEDAELRRLGRSLGMRTDPVVELTETWRRHTREVRRLHEKLFYRPLLNAVARLDAGEARLTPEAARDRLAALGYADPAGALRHLEALTSGVSRRATIQRTLLPVMLGWFADAPNPDAGLLAFRRISDTMGTTSWYLRLLRDESTAAQRLAWITASSRYTTDLLISAPEAVRLLADDDELVPRSREVLDSEIDALIARSEPGRVDDAVLSVRAVRRRELVRVSAADLLAEHPLDVGEPLTTVTAATLRGALAAVIRGWEAEHQRPLPTKFAVIGLGRFGGYELGYGSDADVVFVHDPVAGQDERSATDAALSVATELRRTLMVPSPDPALEIDADLRPEGRQGALVRTVASYAAYYGRWSAVWESQALLRAIPVAGDSVVAEAFMAIIDPLRWPEGGIDNSALLDIRRLKARMEAERLPRGLDPARHLKLGRGGLSDVEWVAQVLTLQHAHATPALRTTRTLTALSAAVEAGLLDSHDASTLGESWLLATRLRNALTLVTGKPSDVLPTDSVTLAGIARLLGYPAGSAGDLVELHGKTARRARTVMERIFYG